MSILGKFTENINRGLENRRENLKEYKLPAVKRVETGYITLKNAIIIAAVAHPLVVLVFWLLLTILALFGIHLTLFDKPQPKVNDIEFVLVDKQDTPKNKNTKYRAEVNSRTGGVNNPKLPVSMPAAASKPTSKPSSSGAPAPKKQSIMDKVAQNVQKTVAPKKSQPAQTTTQKNVQPSSTVQQAVPKPQAAKPQPPTARPSAVRPEFAPKAVQKPTNSPFKVPVPSGGKSAGQYATGPISGSGTSGNGGSRGSGTYSPNPSFAPVGSGSGSKLAQGTGSGTAGRGSGNGGGAGNGGGNPGGGGGRPGIDTIRDPDFGPYMKELQRRIKMHWDPPKGNESKRVVLLFKIAKDGRLLSCSVFKSSGLQNADKAALNAVHLAAPFRPLPAEFKGQSIDIQFTFDYNVYASMGR